MDPIDPGTALGGVHGAGGAKNQDRHAVAPGVEDRHGRMKQPDIGVHRRRHRLAGDLGVAMGDRNRGFLVQAEQHLRPRIADVVDEAVMQAAIARARIERDIGDVEVAQRLGDDVAAEARRIGAGGDRALDPGNRVIGGGLALGRAAAGRGGDIRGFPQTFWILSFCEPLPGEDPSRSGALAQPGQHLDSGIAIGGSNANFPLVIPHRALGFVAETAVAAVGIESERGEAALHFLNFGEREAALAAGKLLHESLAADAIAEMHDREPWNSSPDCR